MNDPSANQYQVKALLLSPIEQLDELGSLAAKSKLIYIPTD